MRTYAADALILRTYRYGEADRIVVFLTEDRGKKRGVAKNASASRRRFGAALEPLTRGRVSYVERENRELVRLDRIEPRETMLGSVAGRSDGDRERALGHAAYFAELLDEWAPDGLVNERLFRLGAVVSECLGREGSVAALARYFEYWLLRLEGVYPAIDACPRCGERVLSAGAVLVPADRSYVCGRCAPGGSRLSAGAMTFLRSLGRLTPFEAAAIAVPVEALREIEDVHHRLIAMHLEKQLRSARIVKELGPDL
jgi:DNA repair protein RecO (recombination protein O)